jgi:hypothetical protein
VPRFPAPPSGLSEPLSGYLRQIWSFIESQPQTSINSFSATATPNSLVSGFPGDMVVNIGSASTNSRLWILGGAARSAITNKGWQLVRVVTPP